MEPLSIEERRKMAEKLPPLQVEGGSYPVDIEATVSSGWVTYGEFVAEPEGKNQ